MSPSGVRITWPAGRMPFLGGYRNKSLGTEFLHAQAQTPPSRIFTEADRKYSRDTQTAVFQRSTAQSQREYGTQMPRPGLLVDDKDDYVVAAGKYFTADELDKLKAEKTLIIQCHFRRHLAVKRTAVLRKQKAERQAFLATEEERIKVEAERRRRREIERRMHPRTAADFAILYNELEAWRLQETKRIDVAYEGADDEESVYNRRVLMTQLLEKETRLIRTIDHLKVVAAEENKKVKVSRMLDDMADDKRWGRKDGGVMKVETPFTTRAQELRELYRGLLIDNLRVDQRLDVLLHVKWTVKEFSTKLTNEIADLVDREADLLNRRRSTQSMSGLRKRIAALFLQFIQTPEFNPESVRHQVVPPTLLPTTEVTVRLNNVPKVASVNR